MLENSKQETFFEKPDNLKEEEKSLKPQETPEEAQQREGDEVSHKFLVNTNPERAANTLAYASIQSVNDSYSELQKAPTWQDNTIDQATKDGITAKYRDLVEGPNGFDAKVQGILEKYANQPGKAKDLQEEMFQAQKQFAVDLGRVVNEANGIINGTPASKDAADAKQKDEAQKIATREQLRFTTNMQTMIEQSKQREIATQKAREMQGRLADKNAATEPFPIEFPGVKV